MTRFDPVPPPPDGLRAALATARRRRLRVAGTTTGATAAGLVLTIAVLAPAGVQTLVQEPAPQRPATTASPYPAASGATTPAPAPRGIAPVAAGASRPTAGAPSPWATAAPPRRGGAVAVAGYAAGPLDRQEGVVTVPGCTVRGQGEGTVGLCTDTAANAMEEGVIQLFAEVCSTRTERTWLHLPGRNDIDLSVLHDGDEVWRWSEWHPDGGRPHVLELETGTCVTWTLRWTVVDRTGRPLPAGDYTLRTTFLAEELAGRDVASVRFTVG